MELMEKYLFITLLYIALIPGLSPQSLDSLFQDAADKALRQTRSRSQPSELRGAPYALNVPERTPSSGGGLSAIDSLNQFSQNNAPEMIQKLDMGAETAERTTKNFVFNEKTQQYLSEFADDDMIGKFNFVSTNEETRSSFKRALESKGQCLCIPRCDAFDPYRSADGSCNNLDEPLLGKSFTPQARIVPNAYNDNVGTPRTLAYNKRYPLPSSRLISNIVFAGNTPTSPKHTTFLTHFGQFIDHDVISTPSMLGKDNKTITTCCRPEMRNYPACFTIDVPPNDPVFQGRTCMNMVRHAATISLDCKSGIREQTNQRSSFIDGTAVYGWNKTRELELRLQRGGRLNESHVIPGLLPEGPCRSVRTSAWYHCFKTGDQRQSETPTLTVIHTTWFRRHNLIADALRAATGITDDETLFQEAKRIVVAELQHITYNEFLPEVLDDRHMQIFHLRSRAFGHDNTYDPSVDPRTFNAFGAAVLRMGHTLVRNIVGHDNGRGGVKRYLLKDHFRKPDLMFRPPYGYEYMARWMSKAPRSRSDRAIVDGLRNKLFEGPPNPNGGPGETLAFDLGALNVQRGREHGLPPYNIFRQFCGRHPVYHFSPTAAGGLVDHTPENAARLASVYRSPHDIDLYAGALTETPIRGGILGPTFSCLLAYQFSLYKHGDRFWYENNNHVNPLAPFTADQLAQIKQITEAKVLCSVVKNDGGAVRYQPKLFKRSIHPGNHQRPCAVILKGNALGFDIAPFAKQLILLRGRRKHSSRGTNPFTRFHGTFDRRHGPRRTFL